MDARTFGEIVKLHRPLLLRAALRLARNRDDAEDLVQETQLRAIRCFHQFQPGSHVETWLTAILTNLFLDQIRHQNVERKAEPELAARGIVEFDPMITGISDADLHAAVEALDPELRGVVELCYFQQKRYRDAAARLGIPVSTVGTRLMRARARLLQLLTTTRESVK